MDRKPLKLAICQMKIENGSSERNLNKIIENMTVASKENCDLILFPELSYTGYLLDRDELKNLSESQDGYFVKTIKKNAKDLKIATIAGYVEKDKLDDNIIYNSCVFINKSGDLLKNFRKVNLWKKEKIKFKSGEDFPVIDTDFGKVSVLICYDIEFPEPSRLVALKGAELVLVPSLWSKFGENRWHTCLSANSLFNLFFMAGANIVDENCCGRSKLVSPMGDTLIEASSDREELLIYTINLDEINRHRNKIPYFEDLNPNIYSDKFLRSY